MEYLCSIKKINMKKSYILFIILIAVAIGVLMSASGEMSTYSTFEEAAKSGDKVKVVGVLSKDKEMYYDAVKDPNYFSFYVKDNKGMEKKVVLKDKKPQDFELTEQIVVTGEMQGEEFQASELLLKCPSKYKDQEVYIKSKS